MKASEKNLRGSARLAAALPLADDATRALIGWYDTGRRELPWRSRPSEYHTLVSEFMLQQTRVDVVCSAFAEFVDRFPTIESLACASEEEVRAQWSGLGYYRRARSLHETAQIIVRNGAFPRTTEALVQLPGIGPYTASAIASIAFGAHVAAVDGNVERVVARLLLEDRDPKSAAGRRSILAGAERLIDSKRPGDSNQALMELGATVCVARSPRCDECVLRPWCRAASAGLAGVLPKRRQARRRRRIVVLSAVVEDGGRLLLVRRGESVAVLAGTWGLPSVWHDAGTPEAEPERMVAELRSRYSIGVVNLGGPTVRHAITHRQLEVRVVRGHLSEDAAEVAESAVVGWFAPAEMDRLATSSLLAKALAALRRDPVRRESPSDRTSDRGAVSGDDVSRREVAALRTPGAPRRGSRRRG